MWLIPLEGNVVNLGGLRETIDRRSDSVVVPKCGKSM